MEIGQTISHYRIVALLGAGGMGVVYRAEDMRLKRAVALKFLPVALGQDRTSRAARAGGAGRLRARPPEHLHDLRDRRDAGRPLFMAMAFYEGETLKERIARGPLPIDEALDIAMQSRARFAARTTPASSIATSSRRTSC